MEKEGITGEALTEGREAQQLSLHPSQASKISQPSSPLTTVIKKENAQLGQTTTKGKKNGYCWVFNIFNFEIILDLYNSCKKRKSTESSHISSLLRQPKLMYKISFRMLMKIILIMLLNN